MPSKREHLACVITSLLCVGPRGAGCHGDDAWLADLSLLPSSSS